MTVIPSSVRAIADTANGDVIATLVVGFLVVDAVAILLIWLAVRKRRGG